MSGESALLPCPFCGGEASGDGHIRYTRPLNDVTWADESPVMEAFFVNCTACGARTVDFAAGGHQTKERAHTAWNQRAHSGDGEEIARLREALEKAAIWFEQYAVDHYDKAKNAPDGREQHSREV